ncbi:MAG: glycosyltransferase family 2 protein [Bacteriovoracaceae bacterium]|jgi:dolichol-phosphate mannosyltransferase|nr:glycosyltransferase family 2 protein [Bacteriovoracaceae bacterium]
MGSESTYQISIIMPALNEQGNIEKAVINAVDAFKMYGINGEIIVVNDGSTDKTGDIVTDLSKKIPFLRQIVHKTPRGIGFSFWDGAQNALGDSVMLIPGDGEIDTGDILRYMPLMNEVDVLVPFFFNKEVRTFKRRIISILYKGIINISFGLLLNYMNGSVIYRRSVLKQVTLSSFGFFYQTELLIKLLKRGYLFAEIPSSLKPREGGSSTALKFKSFINLASGYINTMISVHILDRISGEIIEDSATFRRHQFINRNQKINKLVDINDDLAIETKA